VRDFNSRTKLVVLGISMICAAISAFIAGRLVEARGPKFVLSSILVLAAVTLFVAGGTGSAALVWVLGPAVGVTLGAVWTSDRVFMMRLAPPQLRGEFFAIYNLIGKVSSGVGPLVLWAGTIYLLHDTGSWSILNASRAALGALGIAVIAGLLVLRPLTDETRFTEPDGFVTTDGTTR